jgi:diadenosine tetraphosphate (Ap4A) HIT family hydrolase
VYYHFRKKHQNYNKLNSSDKKQKLTCSLCNAIEKEEPIEESKTMVVLKNRVAYDLWEDHRTTGEHYMIIPRRHVTTLSDFNDEEKLEMLTIAGKYEADRFNVYARGSGAIARSQHHQHTHLIRTHSKRAKILLYIAKPYFVFYR